MPDSIDLQDRDLALLRGLFESRLMTAAHVVALYFDGKKEAAKKRLQKLKAAALIGEQARKAYEPVILSLTRQGFGVLQKEGVLSEYPQLPQSALDKRASVSALTLQHELEIMDAKAAFHSAIKQTESFSVAEFSTWPLLFQFQVAQHWQSGTQVVVKPDGFIRIHEKEADGGVSEHTFFIEVDRSTERQEILLKKALCYMDYYRTGGFAVKNGAVRSAYKDFPFRVLMVLKTAERRNNIAERLLQSTPTILTQVWLSTFQEVITSPLAPIWVSPAAYREAIKGTVHEGRSAMKGTYRRHAERDAAVERAVTKQQLLQ